ncbi:hypothetical protein CR513_59252, partial [Mucuna pruriens]
MEFGDNMVQFNIFEAMTHLIENHFVFGSNVIDVLVDDYMQLHSGLFAFSEFSDFVDVANVFDFADLEGTCDGEVAKVVASEPPSPSNMQPPALELKPLLDLPMI